MLPPFTIVAKTTRRAVSRAHFISPDRLAARPTRWHEMRLPAPVALAVLFHSPPRRGMKQLLARTTSNPAPLVSGRSLGALRAPPLCGGNSSCPPLAGCPPAVGRPHRNARPVQQLPPPPRLHPQRHLIETRLEFRPRLRLYPHAIPRPACRDRADTAASATEFQVAGAPGRRLHPAKTPPA